VLVYQNESFVFFSQFESCDVELSKTTNIPNLGHDKQWTVQYTVDKGDDALAFCGASAVKLTAFSFIVVLLPLLLKIMM